MIWPACRSIKALTPVRDMADSEAIKILGNVWASDAGADRMDPEDVGINRLHGWPAAYEQIGSGAEPEREVWNQRWRELDGYFAEKMVLGILPWDPRIDYVHTAEAASFATGSDAKIYVTVRPSGPAGGNSTDPTAPGQNAWRIY